MDLPAFLKRETKPEEPHLNESLGSASLLALMASQPAFPILKQSLVTSLLRVVEECPTDSERAMALSIGEAKGIVKVLLHYEAVERKTKQAGNR